MSLLAVNPVPWARSQMAFTLAFHIVLVPLGVAWAFRALVASYRGIKRADNDSWAASAPRTAFRSRSRVRCRVPIHRSERSERAMIKALTDLPTPLIGFELSGTLHAEDYRDVLLPAIEKAARAGDVRIVLVIEEFGGITPGAVWQELQMGLH